MTRKQTVPFIGGVADEMARVGATPKKLMDATGKKRGTIRRWLIGEVTPSVADVEKMQSRLKMSAVKMNPLARGSNGRLIHCVSCRKDLTYTNFTQNYTYKNGKKGNCKKCVIERSIGIDTPASPTKKRKPNRYPRWAMRSDGSSRLRTNLSMPINSHSIFISTALGGRRE